MQFKQGDKVECIDDGGNVKYTGVYLGSGHPAASVGVRDNSKIHHAVQIDSTGGTVYLDAYYWTLRAGR